MNARKSKTKKPASPAYVRVLKRLAREGFIRYEAERSEWDGRLRIWFKGKFARARKLVPKKYRLDAVLGYTDLFVLIVDEESDLF
jgi:ribosomal protein S8